MEDIKTIAGVKVNTRNSNLFKYEVVSFCSGLIAKRKPLVVDINRDGTIAINLARKDALR